MTTTARYSIATLILLLLVVMNGPGCRRFHPAPPPGAIAAGPVEVANPLPVPLLDRVLVMDEVSDEIDDFLPILKEERIRDVDGILSEGWIETRPKIGGSLLEPWKKDSTPGFEKWHATLQTVRRFAKVRVIPTSDSYLIDLRVYKELEDREQPLNSTVSGRQLRHDSSLDADLNETFEITSKGWIPQGRDLSLEQVMLRNIQARFVKITQGN